MKNQTRNKGKNHTQEQNQYKNEETTIARRKRNIGQIGNRGKGSRNKADKQSQHHTNER